MTPDSSADPLQAAFARCGAFARDTALPERTAVQYPPGVLLREPTYCDASYRLGGFVAPHRYLIFSSHASLLPEPAPQSWGLCLWQRDRVFKVIDRTGDGVRLQITLLEIPEELLRPFLAPEPNQIERTYAGHGRQMFGEYRLAPPVPELNTDEWRARLEYPVGVNDEGQRYPVFDAQSGPAADPLAAEALAYAARFAIG